MGSSPETNLGELIGVEATHASAVALPFPVLLRVPRLSPEHERPPIVLPPIDRPQRLGKVLAGAMIVLALFLMTRWQRWLVKPEPVPTPQRAPVLPTDDAVTLPPLRPVLTAPIHATLPTGPALSTRPLLPQPTPLPAPPVAQPIIRPGAVRVQPNLAMPVSQPRSHPIIVSVEPGD